MLLIACPWCGPRDQTEYTFVGDGTVRRPADSLAASEAEWLDWVFIRDNPRGPHKEIWQHASGCRRFLLVTRDTLTMRIERVESAVGAAGPVGRSQGAAA